MTDRRRRHSRLHVRTAALAAALALAIIGVFAAPPVAADPASTRSDWTEVGGDAASSGYTSAGSGFNALTPIFNRSSTPYQGFCGTGQNFDDQRPVASATTLFFYDGKRLRAQRLWHGRQVWKTAPIGNIFTSVSALALGEGLVVLAGNAACDSHSATYPLLRAYDQTTGALKWSATPLYSQITTIAVVGTTLLVSGGDGSGVLGVAAVDLITGTTIWRNDSCLAAGQLVVVGGVALMNQCAEKIDTPYHTEGILVSTGVEVWRKSGYWALSAGDSTSVTSGRSFYATSPAGAITAVGSHGLVRWTSADTGQVLAAAPTMLVTDCGTTGTVCGLDPATGLRIWRAVVSQNTATDRATIAGGVVYPYELDLATGAPHDVVSGTLTGRVGVAGQRLWTTSGPSLTVYG